MEQVYDSTQDTKDHKNLVERYLKFLAGHLLYRGSIHDNSKLVPPEKEAFDIHTPALNKLTYGSEEYNKSLEELQVALSHHYSVNKHHPEYHSKGILGMNLIDINEMFADWCAATTRHADGDIFKSIDINAERFGFGEVLVAILKNTARDFNMGKGVDEKGE